MYMQDFVGAVHVYNALMGQRTNTAKLNWLVYNVGSMVRLPYWLLRNSRSDWVTA